MILKFSKQLSVKGIYVLIDYSLDNVIDNITEEEIKKGNKISPRDLKLISNFYESDLFFYMTINNVEFKNNKFIFKVKKGDCVRMTHNNEVILWPNKKSFAISFDIKYENVLKCNVDNILFEKKVYIIEYPEYNDNKSNISYSFNELNNYMNFNLKSKISKMTINYMDDKYENSDNIEIKVKHKLYKDYLYNTNNISKEYELNCLRQDIIDDKKKSTVIINITHSSRFEFFDNLLYIFVNMCLYKSSVDHDKIKKGKQIDKMYMFPVEFKTINDVWEYLNNNIHIFNNFIAEIENMFKHPEDIDQYKYGIINGVCIGYGEFNNKSYDYNYYPKTILYKSSDENLRLENNLRPVYVTTKFYIKPTSLKSTIKLS